MNWLTSQTDVDELKKMFDSFVSKMKTKHSENQSNDGVYISSNMPIETSRKHHGCMGYTKSNKRKKR